MAARAECRSHAVWQIAPLALCLLFVGCSNGRGSVESAQPPTSEQPPTTPPPQQPPTTPEPPPTQPPPTEPGLPPEEPPGPPPVNPPPPPPPPGSFNVGGTITGLRGTGFSLQLNDGQQTLNNPFNGAFAFQSPLVDGTAYTVKIAAQPTAPAQECVLVNPSGTVTGANVTNVAVTCTTQSFRVGGSVTGLAGSNLVLRNGTQTLPIASNGSFRFPAQPSGSTYLILVETQPQNPWQECSVARGEGTVGSGDIQDVRVTCATNSYLLGGNVSGLLGGTVVLRNGSDRVEVQSDGSFSFPTRIASNGRYDVRVESDPETPPQTCSLDAPTGQITNADVNTLQVRCSIRTFRIGGQVTGLVGTGLVLQNNGADNLAVSADGSFRFNTPIASGQTYSVSVLSSPTTPAQRCDVSNPSGTVTTSEVTNIVVTCVRTEFTVSGTVSGLRGQGLVLQNNGGNNLAIAADGTFTFTTSAPTGTPYSVTVASQPSTPTQECVVGNGSGAVNGADVTNITVTCTTSTFPVTAVVSGMAGLFPFVQLRNGGDLINVFSDGTYEFPTEVESGAAYEVTATGGTQRCDVSSGSGTVGAGPVTVQVVCQ